MKNKYNIDLKTSCKPDKFFFDIILNSKSINDTSKNYYIARLNKLVNDIFKEQYKSGGEIKYRTCNINKIIKFPEKFEEKLNQYEKNNLNKEMGYHSKDSYVVSIKSIFNHNSDLKNSNIELFQKWDDIHNKIREPIEHKYLSNEPDEKQKKAYIPYEEITKIRDAIDNNNKNTQKRLLLFMYTEIPPMRGDYDKLKIYYDHDEIIDEGNYIFISKKDDSKIILNEYKTAKKYKKFQTNLPDLLLKEIINSLKLQPREYLFTGQNGQVYDSKGTFIKWANRTLKSLLNNEYITLSSLRHIYISRRDLMLETKSGLEQKKIADAMGHSVAMQKRYNWHCMDNIK